MLEEDKLKNASTSQQLMIMAQIITICANGYVDYTNSGLIVVDPRQCSERLIKHTTNEFMAILTPAELSEGLKICMEEINFSMGVDTPANLKLKEKDYELEELEKEKKRS